MSTVSKQKIGVNDKCPCLSGKKYKKCCMNNDQNNSNKYYFGQSDSSEIIQDCMDIFKSHYPKYNMINITDDLTPETYVNYQKRNYYNKIIMFAERTENNENVFEPRSDSSESDIIIMYHGHYRTFKYEDFDNLLSSLKNMITEANNQQNQQKSQKI